MDSTELLRFVGFIAVMIMIIPGLIYGLRKRKAAIRNIFIWFSIFGIGFFLYWLQIR
ncbi:MAG: hypothetical protein CFH42_01379 [Alphaproteobacteria bacterium MarineAlpha12_Bin1]|nr:MAG: hypothetical protein CFH42_01379 [Alphaproteobacteria bacterium MarineAlpha12_Bin1]